MKMIPLFITCVVLVLSTCSTAFPYSPNQASDGKVFLLGGAVVDTTASVYTAMKAATGKSDPKIVVAISAAGSLEVGLEAYYEDIHGSWSYERLFRFYGFQPSVLLLAVDNYLQGSSNTSTIGQENIRLVEEADMVFFNGGDQSRHARSWFKDDGTDSDLMAVLRRKFSEGTVVAGTSAGAAMMGELTYGEGYSFGYYYFNADLKPCRIGENLRDDRQGENSFRYEENGGYMKGFGFIQGALVDTHFDARGRIGRLPVAMRQLRMSYGYGVGEDTAVFVDGNTATVYGSDGAWFMDSTEALVVNETYFAVWGLKGSYLTAGDSIDLSTKEVTTTKEVFSSGSGNPYRSYDIFSSGEAVRCATSLMSSSITLGQTTGESYESRPTTNVIFYKGRGETGYYSESTRKYTITNMLMDVRTL